MNLLFLYPLVVLGLGIVHEAGHWTAFQLYGRKVKLSFRWYGVDCGEERDHYALSPPKNVVVYAAGVVGGAVPLLWFKAELLYFVYAGLCLADVGDIIRMLKVPLAYWQKPYGEYVDSVLRGIKNNG